MFGTRVAEQLVSIDVVGFLHSVVDFSKRVLCPEEVVFLEELPTTLIDPVELVRQVALPAILGEEHFLDNVSVDEPVDLAVAGE